MITLTDAINTVEFESYYVILPSSKPNWKIKDFIDKSSTEDGKLITDEFSYSSETNKLFLTVEEIRHLIGEELNV